MLSTNDPEQRYVLRDENNNDSKMVQQIIQEDFHEDSSSIQRRLDFIPTLHVRGTHFNVGLSIGRAFKSMIAEMLDSWNYFNEIWTIYQTKEGGKRYERCLKHCIEKFPQYVEEIKGMAAGSGVPFEKLFLLNIDSIINDSPDSQGRGETGCTTIICNKTERVLGHTEDSMKEILNNIYIVSAEIVDKCGNFLEKFTTLCYAGHLMGYTMGFNENMVYTVNTLFPPVFTCGSPRAFIARAILRASNLDEIVDILRDSGTGISDGMSLNLHFPNTNEKLFYNIEVHPPSSDGETLPESSVDILCIKPGQSAVHCNKYLRFVTDEQSTPKCLSTGRHKAIDQYPEAEGLSDLKHLLSDQSNQELPVFICDDIKSNVSYVKTVAVGFFDLIKKKWSIYVNRPSQTAEPLLVLPLPF